VVDLRRDVERPALAVDDDLGLADRHLDVGTRLRNVGRAGRGVVRDRRAHLLEHRAERNEDGVPAHERGQNAILAQHVRFGVDVPVVEEDRDLTRRRRAEVGGRRLVRLGDLLGREVAGVALRCRLPSRSRRRTKTDRDDRCQKSGAQSFH